MEQFIRWIQHIDRRWIYLALGVGLVLSLVFGRPVTPEVLDTVRDLYTAVEQAPAGEDDGKIVVIGVTFSASTLPETGNQTRALMRHLMLRKKRFAIMAIAEPQAEPLARQIADELSVHYGYEYGKDWISFGYKPGTLAQMLLFSNNIPKAIGEDPVMGKPIESFPIMQGISSIKDVSLVVEVTATASVTSWIYYVQSRHKLTLGYGCTGVMAAEAYPFLDSKQLVGMMPGMKGAADYERLVDDLEAEQIAASTQKPYAPTKQSLMSYTARKLMFTQGIAHLIIIGFIILGNIGFFAARYLAARRPKEETNG